VKGRSDIESLLLRATAGDLDAFRSLEDVASGDDFRPNAYPELTLSRKVLHSVLSEVRANRVNRSLAERWAFFMLTGYLDIESERSRRIDSHIDVDMDQLVVDILNRLSMYDDLPGPVTDAEIDSWVRSLGP